MTLLIWVGLVFILGAAIGSGLNVCIVRIPYEKSILWPSSHCGRCYQPVRWYDNVPLLSYWLLRGRCRSCGASFSARYFFVELFTALAFVGLFWVEIVRNVHRIPALEAMQFEIRYGVVPLTAWLFWLGHALLLTFLIVAVFTDLEHMEIPLPITVTGTLVGLGLALCFPWPWPGDPQGLAWPRRAPFGDPVPVLGWQPWPLWDPRHLPAWLAPGSWQLGLATGLAGVLAGVVILRGVRFLFGVGRGVEGLGLGDADLMMMVGAFLGWQVVLIAFFVSVFPGLILGLVRLFLFRDQHLPFGPALALGTLLTLLGWRLIGPALAPVFFDRLMMTVLAVSGAVFLLGTSFALRLLGPAPAGLEEGAGEGAAEGASTGENP